MIAEELTKLALEKMKTFSIQSVLPALRMANQGAIEDVLNTNGCANYQWFPCLIEVIKPKQIVELGGAMGVGSIMMLQSKYQDFKLYSITLPENKLEFSYVVDKYPNFYPIVGNDLDMNNWKDIDLSQTDLWYFDSEHTEEQLRKELGLYSPFFKKDAIVCFDDIHINDGMQKVWDEIREGKWGFSEYYDATDPLHWSGYGVTKV